MSFEPVDWALAARVAGRVSRRHGELHRDERSSLDAQFADLTARAEELVEAETGLRSLVGPARAQVVDRVEWSRANVESFRRLLAPITAKLGAQVPSGRGAMRATRSMAGAEVGVLLGWMSSRVLGQYDLLVVDEQDPASADVVYYVGNNVLALEARFGFDPDQFRMWLALHEVTHRAQFTGVPWMREHFLSLVAEAIGGFDPDPQRFLAALRSVSRWQRSQALADGGLLGLLAGDEQRAKLDRISGLMSLLEGHGDVTMNRAGAAVIPEAARFARVLGERRKAQPASTRFVQRLLGLEAKLAQYEQGEQFLAAIESHLGRRAIDECWRGPEHLPTLGEIRDPQRWLDRVALLAA
ncbi:MAG: zinc-dependent metalloprotease [Acidimicrobiia bacterium]